MSKNKIRMKRLFFVLLGVALYVQAEAQPARRRVKPNDADKAEKTVDRASSPWRWKCLRTWCGVAMCIVSWI